MVLPWQSYGTSPVTALPATRHKWTCPALTQARRRVLDSSTPKTWKAELAFATRQWNSRELNSWPLDHKSYALTTKPPSHPKWFSVFCRKSIYKRWRKSHELKTQTRRRVKCCFTFPAYVIPSTVILNFKLLISKFNALISVSEWNIDMQV